MSNRFVTVCAHELKWFYGPEPELISHNLFFRNEELFRQILEAALPLTNEHWPQYEFEVHSIGYTGDRAGKAPVAMFFRPDEDVAPFIELAQSLNGRFAGVIFEYVCTMRRVVAELPSPLSPGPDGSDYSLFAEDSD